MSVLLMAGAMALVPVNYGSNPNIRMVVCDEGRGTAFRIGPSTYASVDHVTSNSHCRIDGQLIKIKHASRAQDFSIITVPARSRSWMRIDCTGYRPGNLYYANGYAHGQPLQRILVGMATPHSMSIRLFAQPMQIIWGTQYIPGMSGGPVQNNRGEVTGLVNAYDRFNPVSFSRSLKDTVLCR